MPTVNDNVEGFRSAEPFVRDQGDLWWFSALKKMGVY